MEAIQIETDTSAHERAQLKADPNYDPASDPVVRASGLGGSNMSSVLGMNPWTSNVETWARLRGTWKDGDKPADMNDDMRLGIEFEGPIANLVCEDMGIKMQRFHQTQRHPGHPFLMAHPDRRVVGKYKGKKAVFEAKMTALRDRWGSPDGGTVADHVAPQVHQHMLCTDADLCIVGVLFVGWRRERAVYIVERDREWDDILIEAGHEFWNNHVLPGEPPVADFTQRQTQEAITKLYGHTVDEGSFTRFGVEADALLKMHEFNKEQARRYGDAAAANMAQLIADHLGHHQFGLFGDGRWLRTKITKRKGYEVEPSEYVDNKIVKNLPKGVEAPDEIYNPPGQLEQQLRDSITVIDGGRPNE